MGVDKVGPGPGVLRVERKLPSQPPSGYDQRKDRKGGDAERAAASFTSASPEDGKERRMFIAPGTYGPSGKIKPGETLVLTEEEAKRQGFVWEEGRKPEEE